MLPETDNHVEAITGSSETIEEQVLESDQTTIDRGSFAEVAFNHDIPDEFEHDPSSLADPSVPLSSGGIVPSTPDFVHLLDPTPCRPPTQPPTIPVFLVQNIEKSTVHIFPHKDRTDVSACGSFLCGSVEAPDPYALFDSGSMVEYVKSNPVKACGRCFVSSVLDSHLYAHSVGLRPKQDMCDESSGSEGEFGSDENFEDMVEL